MTTAAPSAQAAAPTVAAPDARAKAAPSRRRFILIGVALTLAAAGTAYGLNARRFAETDDAQVDGSISNVSPRVSGTVASVLVVENQRVKAGDVLAEIDTTDLKIALDQSRATVAQAQALLAAEDPSVPIMEASNLSAVSTAQSDMQGAQASLAAAHKDVEQLTAQLAQATANDRTAQLDKQRAEQLLKTGAVSQSEYDAKLNAASASAAGAQAIAGSLAAAKDRVAQQQSQVSSVQSRLGEIQSNAPRQVATRQASVLGKRAALDLATAQLAQAEKNLSYALIRSPIDGIVAKKSIAVGDHVAPGQLVVALSQVQDLYVTANYRETQLERISVGESASVHVDAIDAELHGQIESIGGATGSRLSVLPPENATGNYVKVVQRIPVRVKLLPGQPGLDRLRIGMSVESKVTLQ